MLIRELLYADDAVLTFLTEEDGPVRTYDQQRISQHHYQSALTTKSSRLPTTSPTWDQQLSVTSHSMQKLLNASQFKPRCHVKVKQESVGKNQLTVNTKVEVYQACVLEQYFAVWQWVMDKIRQRREQTSTFATDHFTHLGSTVTSSFSLAEITKRIKKAAAVMSKLSKRVWGSNQLTVNTKFEVYQACVLEQYFAVWQWVLDNIRRTREQPGELPPPLSSSDPGHYPAFSSPVAHRSQNKF